MGGQHGGDGPAAGQQGPGQGVVVDDVDLAVLQQPGGAGGVDDLGERLAEPVAWRDGVGGQERRRGQGPTGADQGDLVATVDQALGQLGAECLDAAVAGGTSNQGGAISATRSGR
jgi:hypothetical protein